MSERAKDVDEFDFSDLTPIEIPIKNLKGQNYVLVESDGETGAKFKSRSAQTLKMADGKVAGFGEIGNLEAYFLSLCMKVVSDDPAKNGKAVTEATIKTWPAKVVKRLFNKAKEISELDEDTEESLEKVIKEATKKLEKLRGESIKKEPESTTDG